jgi:PIN domain nuclease of toxin-antitoxin system
VRILLDTCSFLWLAGKPADVSARARELFADPDNEIFLSVVSCWEIAAKHSAGRLELPDPPARFIVEACKRAGIESLPLEEEAVLYVSRLPKLHSYPFDRMLICQSIVHGVAILTPDERIAQYPIHTIW